MPETKLGSADYTAMNSIDQTDEDATDFRRTVSTAEQDTPGTRYYPDWSKWFGYYKDVPEIQSVINKKAIWTVGKGYQTNDEKTKKILEKIKGCGKDTFNDIIFNSIITYTACGDSFAEIVRNAAGQITNIKPMNPGSIVVLSDEYGIITGYEQVILPRAGKKAYAKKFKPKDVFHLCWNRMGDECHGRSTIEKLQWMVDAKNEAQKDMRIIFHRYVKPLIITAADTDDEDEIADLKTKLDKAVENMENMIVPKDTVTMERMSIPQYSTLDPIPWIQLLQTYFIMAEGVPEVIMGYGRDTTEASSKILYLAFQQNIEHNQLFLEQQIKSQMNLDVEFEFPENISPEISSDFSKARRADNMEMKVGDANAGRGAGQGATAGRRGK